MDARRKQELKELMVTAWNLARFGANRFGGQASLYFWMALRIAWRERGGKSVYYTKGNVASNEEVSANVTSIAEAIDQMNTATGHVSKVSDELAEMMKYFE